MGACRARRAAAHAPASRGVEANRELFDALEFAATVARLDLRELVDAYLAGVPQLDFDDAWTEVEDWAARYRFATRSHQRLRVGGPFGPPPGPAEPRRLGWSELLTTAFAERRFGPSLSASTVARRGVT